MTANAAIRVLLPCRSPSAELLRTLVSLSTQDIATARLELVFLSHACGTILNAETRLLCNALGLRHVEELDCGAFSPAQALNHAATGGKAATLALLPEGARLHKRFFSRCLEALGKSGAEASFSAHTAGYADMRAAIRRRPFRPEQMARHNAVGPAALVRRETWQALGGLRAGMRLALWDFWLRLLMSGRGMPSRRTSAAGPWRSCAASPGPRPLSPGASPARATWRPCPPDIPARCGPAPWARIAAIPPSCGVARRCSQPVRLG
jgi:hypothetical protein